jgi:hypothetical protein
VKSNPTYDQGGGSSNTTPDGALWVRAVGVSNCRTAVLLAKVSAQEVAITLPQDAVDANGFADSNNGNKVIVDTLGTYAQPSLAVANPSGQPGPMSMRCTGLTPSACKNFRSGQVYPDTTNAAASPAITLTSTELAAVRSLAIADGTWWGTGSPNGTCPTSVSQLTGSPTYIDGPCNMSFTGNGDANSSTSPGFMVLANGTVSFSGTTNFYGVIYAANQQSEAGTPCDGNDVVDIHGNGIVQGAIIVDGTGTVCFGSSKTNFVYDLRGFSSADGWGGAAATPDSFRQLPQGQ